MRDQDVGVVAKNIVNAMLCWISEGNTTVGTICHRLPNLSMEKYHNGRGAVAHAIPTGFHQYSNAFGMITVEPVHISDRNIFVNGSIDYRVTGH